MRTCRERRSPSSPSMAGVLIDSLTSPGVILLRPPDHLAAQSYGARTRARTLLSQFRGVHQLYEVPLGLVPGAHGSRIRGQSSGIVVRLHDARDGAH